MEYWGSGSILAWGRGIGGGAGEIGVPEEGSGQEALT